MLGPGLSLGPYKLVAPIGAGGMGEVWRATDTRLGREVAVKVLARDLSQTPEALVRFEQEARAAGMLNHPNILSVYDVGESGPHRYIVSELLEGESLRARLRQGPIPPRKATEYAVQVARGLAAAHEKGIIHRDLKPENLFITRDGSVKILDFGLVKLMTPRIPGLHAVDEHAQTVPGVTEPGRMLGTVGYMAPEQVRGNSGDQRSDIFAFGAILFEMLAARPAFQAESPIETLNAIIKEDPPDLLDVGVRVPPALERVIRHCLEKNPEERFQSARDLAFGLGSMSGLTSQAISYRPFPRRRRIAVKPLLIALAIVAALAAAFAAAYWAGTKRGTRAPAPFRRLTFRSGTIVNARFSPDGQTVFYGARWAGNPMTIFSVRPDSPESRDLALGVSDILAVSSTGQLAISLNRHPMGYLRDVGTLAQVPIAGGAPREILEDVEAADWSPDGKSLAIVRTVDGHCRLEYPVGKVLYDTIGWISHPRISPDGATIAFLDHPFVNDDRGTVAVVSANGGAKRTLTPEWHATQGLAWTPDGSEIWFTAERGTGGGRTINAVSLRGKDRVVTTSPSWLWLHDIGRDGRVLVTQQSIRAGIIGAIAGEPRERDLSWLDYSVVRDLSTDGKTILFSESGEGGGSIFGIYLRKVDGSPAIRLGEGTTESLSPDGEWVLTIPRDQKPAQIRMLPTGTGQARAVTSDRINHRNARWFPDGRRILFSGNEPGQPPRLWMQDVAGGAPRAITPPNVTGTVVTPDGTRVLGRTEERKFFLYPVAGGEPQPVPALKSGDVPVRFSADGTSLYVGTFGKIPAVLTKVNLTTGERVVHREARPADPAGLINVGPILVTPDGATTVYSYTRLLSDLYLMDAKQ